MFFGLGCYLILMLKRYTLTLIQVTDRLHHKEVMGIQSLSLVSGPCLYEIFFFSNQSYHHHYRHHQDESNRQQPRLLSTRVTRLTC